MSHFMGKDGFVWWQGVVEDRHDPLYLGRCKVRILGWHSENKNDQPTVGLPWAYPVAPITSASQTGVGSTPLGPVEGTWVLGFYRDGEAGQEPMFFGTLGGIPELDAKGVNNDGTSVGGQGFLDPRIEGGDKGHKLFPDEKGSRDLYYDPTVDMVPREPATIIHNARPNPSEKPTYTLLGNGWAAKGTGVRSIISNTGPNAASAPFTVKVVEQQFRSTFPDTGLPDKRLSATRNLDYLKEPTTNRLARGVRGNSDTSDPRQSGIVFEKMENRKAGQMDIPTADGKSWSEPKVPWQAIYPYNHVHQTESGHIVEMDDTPNWERMHWYHRTGTFTEIHPIGIKVDKIVNNYYDIILGSKYEHIEANEYTTIDGSQENYVIGSRVDRVDGDYSVAVKKGRFNVNNPTGSINLEGSNMVLRATESFSFTANNVVIEKKSGIEKTTGDEEKRVGGKLKIKSGATSLNAQGSLGFQAGGGLSINVTDSMNETIFGVLPGVTLGYAKNTTSMLGKIKLESGAADMGLTGGIELNLGLAGISSSITQTFPGDIDLTSTLGLKGITATAWLGDIKMDTLLSTLTLGGMTGSAEMKGLLGEVSVSAMGKVKVKGLIASLKEILDEMIDIITEHTHPTGTGPSGPPMPPASVKLPLLKSLKIGMSLE